MAIGVRCSGHKEIFGIWIEQTERAKFWLRVMSELRNRGVQDILIAVRSAGFALVELGLEPVRQVSGQPMAQDNISGDLHRLGRWEKSLGRQAKEKSDLRWTRSFLCRREWAVGGHSRLKHPVLVADFSRHRFE